VARHVGQTGELEVGFSQLLAALVQADSDHITGLALFDGDVGMIHFRLGWGGERGQLSCALHHRVAGGCAVPKR